MNNTTITLNHRRKRRTTIYDRSRYYSWWEDWEASKLSVHVMLLFHTCFPAETSMSYRSPSYGAPSLLYIMRPDHHRTQGGTCVPIMDNVGHGKLVLLIVTKYFKWCVPSSLLWRHQSNISIKGGFTAAAFSIWERTNNVESAALRCRMSILLAIQQHNQADSRQSA